MARLPRLAIAGQAHLALMLGHGAQPVFADDDDRQAFLAALRDAARQHGVAVHAYALQANQVLLLLTPTTAGALGALMQGLGRRYGAAFNRRHGRRGSLWAGRFRTAVVQPGPHLLEALLHVDLQGAAGGTPAVPWCSLGHHLGERRDPLITDCSAWWALGNTPFEREAAYRRCLDDGLAPGRAAALADAAHKGWAVGDAAFLSALALQADRPVQPRPRGRPPRTA
ncbi:MAG: transposase [Aquabacterium sp.]|nr:transposase [Aquabacterium sp.]